MTCEFRKVPGVAFNRDAKFDFQLEQALVDERRLAEIFAGARIERVELKTERHQWLATGNICIEFERDGKPSGIAATKADMWVHELQRDGGTLVYLMFPVEALKRLARQAIRRGWVSRKAGDGGRQSVALIPLSVLTGLALTER